MVVPKNPIATRLLGGVLMLLFPSDNRRPSTGLALPFGFMFAIWIHVWHTMKHDPNTEKYPRYLRSSLTTSVPDCIVYSSLHASNYLWHYLFPLL